LDDIVMVSLFLTNHYTKPEGYADPRHVVNVVVPATTLHWAPMTFWFRCKRDQTCSFFRTQCVICTW